MKAAIFILHPSPVILFKIMSITVLLGAQWGDEGKGRITDALAHEADLVARFNGGDNAGHSITIGNTVVKLHLVPSGIFRPACLNVIGNGVADPSEHGEALLGIGGRGGRRKRDSGFPEVFEL